MARRARRTDVAQLLATLSGLGLVREVTPDGAAGGAGTAEVRFAA
jgi:hypothetical protein